MAQLGTTPTVCLLLPRRLRRLRTERYLLGVAGLPVELRKSRGVTHPGCYLSPVFGRKKAGTPGYQTKLIFSATRLSREDPWAFRPILADGLVFSKYYSVLGKSSSRRCCRDWNCRSVLRRETIYTTTRGKDVTQVTNLSYLWVAIRPGRTDSRFNRG